MSTYVYNQNTYDTKEQLDAAITALKVQLDTMPSTWVSVKELSGDAISGWVVPVNSLSDAQILNPDTSKFYNVSAIYDGITYTAVSGVDLAAKVNEVRTSYARYIQANTIVERYAPTNEDMSLYV